MQLQLEHIQIFHAVAQSGSFSAAANALRLSHPTVRRHVEALEQNLGITLFTRAPNGLTLTDAAEQLLPMAGDLMEQAKAFGRAAQTTKLSGGVVRLTSTPLMAAHILPSVLASLRIAAPDIRIELLSSPRVANLSRRAADIAIRMGEPKEAALVAQKLPPVEFALYCAPSIQPPQTLEAIMKAPMISDDRDGFLEPKLDELGFPARENIVFCSDDDSARIAAIVAGMGIGPLPVCLGETLGLKRCVFEMPGGPARVVMPCYALIHEDQRNLPVIRTAFDHLVRELSAIFDTPDGGVKDMIEI